MLTPVPFLRYACDSADVGILMHVVVRDSGLEMAASEFAESHLKSSYKWF